jgi:hypothetical protein
MRGKIMAKPLRMRVSRNLYHRVVKPIYFKFDPEYVHNTLVSTGGVLGSNPVTRRITSLSLDYRNPILQQRVMGITFRNPVGLSAGFDKNGDSASIMESVGFGFTEIGSVTGRPCKGNTGVRLTRLREKKSILVHLGLNNRGAVETHTTPCRKGHRHTDGDQRGEDELQGDDRPEGSGLTITCSLWRCSGTQLTSSS